MIFFFRMSLSKRLPPLENILMTNFLHQKCSLGTQDRKSNASCDSLILFFDRQSLLQLTSASIIDPTLPTKVTSKGFPLAHSPSPLDVSQGELGDCYLLSALSAIAENQKLREDLFLEGNPKYSLYIVRLFVSGKSVLVVRFGPLHIFDHHSLSHL